MERPDFFTLKNGDKAKLPFTDQEYQRRLTNLRTVMSKNNIDIIHQVIQPYTALPEKLDTFNSLFNLRVPEVLY